jgi:hypothetical protein
MTTHSAVVTTGIYYRPGCWEQRDRWMYDQRVIEPAET